MSNGATDAGIEVVWKSGHMHRLKIHVGGLIVVLRGSAASKKTHRIEEVKSTFLAGVQLRWPLLVLEGLVQRL